MHSSHSFVFDSDPELLGTDYTKAHTSLSLPFFLEQKKIGKKTWRYFPNCNVLSRRKTSTLARQSSLALNAETASLTGSYTLGPAENLVFNLPRSKGTEQVDFILPETLTKNSHSGHAIFHLCLCLQFSTRSGYICTGNLTHLNSKRCPTTACVHAECLYMAQKLNLALKLWPSRNAGTLVLYIDLPYGYKK